ncbi:MAG TPA: TerC family protein [Casimicrobiaceae bacterium]|nr:TerC family protein [Casimicrobiaceae bacterium]
MVDFLNPQFWAEVAEIIVVNILLSGDNAVVIALACRNLPPRRRRQGIFWGAVGATGLRIAFTFFAVTLLAYPYLKLVGAALLVWIGIKLIAQEENGGHKIKASDRLLTAIWTILVADVVMSLDNVLAVAAAAEENVPLMVFGLAVSIPIVIWGSQFVTRLMERYPVLIFLGGGLLGYIAGEMGAADLAVRPWIEDSAPVLATVIPFVGLTVVMGTGAWLMRRRARTQE